MWPVWHGGGRQVDGQPPYGTAGYPTSNTTADKVKRLARVRRPKGQMQVIAPSGYHDMLTDLTATLKEGDRFPVTLTFGKAAATAAAMSGLLVGIVFLYLTAAIIRIRNLRRSG